MRFTDTAEPINPANLLPTPGLVMMKLVVGGESTYVAPLGLLAPSRVKPPAEFAPWWNSNVTKEHYSKVFDNRMIAVGVSPL
jgi:hypothetical protein